MFKRFAGLVVIAASVAACSNEATAPRMVGSEGAAFSKGVASPNTTVTSQITVHVAAHSYYAGTGPSRNGQGQCRTHTDGSVGWYWVPGNGPSGHDQEVGPNHVQCLFETGATDIVVNFALGANYVKSTSGNMELNFDQYCDVSAVCYSPYVHYLFNKNYTTGGDLLHGTAVISSVLTNWTIDLAQVTGPGNAISDPPRSFDVIAHNVEGLYPDSPATISW